MSAAPPAAPPPVGDPGLNGHAPGHNMNLPRFHPIAINPNGPGSTPSGPPPYHRPYGSPYQDHPPPHQHSTGSLPPPLPPAPAPHQYQQHQHQHLQPQSAPPSQQHQQQQQQNPQQHTQQPGPPSRPPSHPPILPVPMTSQLDQIEARLRQIEQEEGSRAAARAHMLAMRRREDEEFRMVTERAEAEEEELRRRRKRLKRESMGLLDGQMESPPAPAPRRLSETSAATTLAFFKQQTPPEPRPSDLRAPPPHQHQHQQQSHNPSPPTISQQPTPMAPAPSTSIMSNPHGNTFRKKQKYTIKNAEAWGERHGRPATYDAEGRALWKRPSDGRLVYLDCPAPDCGKSDFVTLHGFMCHLTKKHKDRTLGSQSRALEVCGTVYDPNAPRPQRPSLKRDSSGNSRGGSVHTEPDMDEEEDAYSTSASDIHDDHNTNQLNHLNNGLSLRENTVKKEETGSPVTSASAVVEQPSSNKASIASMIDGDVTNDHWAKKSSIPDGSDTAAPALTENESVIATTTAEDAAAAAVLAGRTIQV
ncbi:hypothetical protein TMatcc_007828 [Talaromyces marneffei ATCC 18224]|uniref:Uncharacterized protein n=1 Tax=Talaromyces marneffei (strain ATCC 18224 / CBS 334.59 / QM 7333) TaxID=441960 RepID=B6QD30_TALMQ|nr:conserved hypothetical protein [Talaromyces marneffei ATCC 18224]